MASIVDTLRELHRLRKLIRDLQTQIEEEPAAFATQQSRLTRTEAELPEARDALKHLKVSVHEKEVSLKGMHQQIVKYEKQRETASSKKELDAFDHEIDHTRKKIAALEDEIFAGLGEIDERTAKIPEIEKELARIREETARFQSEAQDRHQLLVSELERAKAEVAAAEKTLPEDVRPPYQRLVGFYGPDALAAVRDRTCTSCYASMTVQHTRELEAGRFVTCKNCGRALYL